MTMTVAAARRCARDLSVIALREWDRLLIGAFFAAFGVTDLVTPDITNRSAFLELFRAGQFIAAGVLIVVGVLTKSYLCRALGTILYACGLATVAVIVVLGSGSPTLWLIGAFALQGFADLRRLKGKNEREAVVDEVVRARRARERR